MTPFRTALQLWQDRRGWSDRETAEALRVSLKSVRNWRQGDRDPPLSDALLLLMQLLDERDGIS